jgi:hypothetical protein
LFFISAGREDSPPKGGSLQMIREEDKVEDVSLERFTRVQRALDGRNVGLKREDFGAVSPSKSGKIDPNGASSRRAGVLFTRDSEENDYIQEEHELTVAQNNLRHAQDMLLLEQLDKGVLPERFIRQGVHDDPRHVSVVLSKFGIGDTRGICLGKWYALVSSPRTTVYFSSVCCCSHAILRPSCLDLCIGWSFCCRY